MDYAHFTETEKSKKSEVKCEKNRAPGIRSFCTGCESGILLGDFEATECAKKTLTQLCDPVFGLSGMDRRSPPTLCT